MAQPSVVRSTASGSTDVFSVPFPYLDKSHVHLYLNGVEVAYTWVSNGSIKVVGGNPTVGTDVMRRRITPSDPLVEFAPGNLEADDLNTAHLQVLYLAQEASDWVADQMNHTIRIGAGDPSQTLPSPLDENFLGWDGNTLANYSLIDILRALGFTPPAVAPDLVDGGSYFPPSEGWGPDVDGGAY